MEKRPEDHSYFRVSASRRSPRPRPKWLIIVLAIICIAGISWVAVNYEGFDTATDVIPELQFTEVVRVVTSTPNPTTSPTYVLTLPTIETTSTPITVREAPLGTIALKSPSSVVISTSTVGFPRESNISRACIFCIVDIFLSPFFLIQIPSRGFYMVYCTLGIDRTMLSNMPHYIKKCLTTN